MWILWRMTNSNQQACIETRRADVKGGRQAKWNMHILCICHVISEAKWFSPSLWDASYARGGSWSAGMRQAGNGRNTCGMRQEWKIKHTDTFIPTYWTSFYPFCFLCLIYPRSFLRVSCCFWLFFGSLSSTPRSPNKKTEKTHMWHDQRLRFSFLFSSLGFVISLNPTNSNTQINQPIQQLYL